MQLMPQYVVKKLPKLYSVENDKDPVVKCKFFLPMTKWYWYAMEFDGKDTFFGFVVGDYNELGYFSLSELKSIEGPYGLKVERDLYFDSTPLSKVKALHESNG
jgi:hypothetical protein